MFLAALRSHMLLSRVAYKWIDTTYILSDLGEIAPNRPHLSIFIVKLFANLEVN